MNLLNRSIESLRIDDRVFSEKNVITVKPLTSVLEALQLMENNEIVGMAVLDDSNKIVANFSAGNLRVLLLFPEC